MTRYVFPSDLNEQTKGSLESFIEDVAKAVYERFSLPGKTKIIATHRDHVVATVEGNPIRIDIIQENGCIKLGDSHNINKIRVFSDVNEAFEAAQSLFLEGRKEEARAALVDLGPELAREFIRDNARVKLTEELHGPRPWKTFLSENMDVAEEESRRVFDDFLSRATPVHTADWEFWRDRVMAGLVGFREKLDKVDANVQVEAKLQPLWVDFSKDVELTRHRLDDAISSGMSTKSLAEIHDNIAQAWPFYEKALDIFDLD